MRKNVAIILAGGLGKRMKSSTPKQFLVLQGKPIIIHALKKFENSPLIDEIIVVALKSHLKHVGALVKKYGFKKISKIVEGGATRQESSYRGLKACQAGTEIVLIHDAVRPFVDARIIKDVIRAAEKTGAAAPAVDSADTVVLVKGDLIANIPERRTVRRVQTPQGFLYKIILKAHEEARKSGVVEATDDCFLIRKNGGEVRIIMGAEYNRKITDQADLKFVCGMLKRGLL